jgi:hypothetical protein
MSLMGRGGSRLAWLLSLPLCVAGWLAAHSLAYRVVEPDGERHVELLERTGHAYLEHAAPYFLAVCLTLLLAGLAATTLAGATRSFSPQAPLAHCLLPPVGFIVQEHLECLLTTGGIPLQTVLAPTFVMGLALQVPLGLSAFLVARALVDWARRMGRGLIPCWRPRLVAIPLPAPFHLETGTGHRPAVPVLALGHAQRGPPSGR